MGENVEDEGLNASFLNTRHLGRVPGCCVHVEAGAVEGEREGCTEAAVGAACDQDSATRTRTRHGSVDGTMMMGVDGMIEVVGL